MPTVAGDYNWGEGLRWHTADIALTYPSVNEKKRRCLLELTMAAGGGRALAHARWSTDTCKSQLGQ